MIPAAPYASPTVQHRALVVAFLALVTRPCDHDPADLREESTGIECATCGRAYRVKADRGAK
jgi:hypothetical protein